MSLAQPSVYPDRLESGTLNLPGIAGLEGGIDFIRSFGGEKEIFRKESELIGVLREDLSVIKGVKLYTEMQGGRSSNVLSFNLGDLHSELTAARLSRYGICLRAGYHCSYLAHKTYGTQEKGCVRVSTGPFNSKKDVKNLAICLNKIANGKKI